MVKAVRLNSSRTVTAALKTGAKENNLSAIRKFISERMKKADFSRKKISALTVSATELCENLIRHAYGKKGGEIRLKLEIKYPAAALAVLDRGPKFNMKKKRIPDIRARLKKGLGGKMGIKTILALCDKVEYKRKGRFNENRLTVLEKARTKNPG